MTGKQNEERRKLREEILATLDAAEIDPQRQKTAVMTRLDNSLVEFLDALVKLKIYHSRSDAVANIIKKTILAEPEVYERIRIQAQKLDEIESATEELAQQVRKGE
ncbi:MAG: hypothetical protein ACFFAY_15690 [Promethearchaeota archaeon]